MPDLFAESSLNIQAIIILLTATIFYLLYEFLNLRPIFKGLIEFLSPGLSEKSQLNYSRKLSGFFLLGVIPFLIVYFFLDLKPADIGLNFNNGKKTLFYILILIPLPPIVNFFAAKSKANLSMYPQFREKVFTRNYVVSDLLSWALYLFGYEIMFRGLLLFGLIPVFGVWVAIAVNIMAYTYVHIIKGPGEGFGSMVMGTLLCIICVITGNIWVAFVVHVCLSWSNEIFSLKYHPEFQYTKKRI